jgi:hypothetical protein
LRTELGLDVEQPQPCDSAGRSFDPERIGDAAP